MKRTINTWLTRCLIISLIVTSHGFFHCGGDQPTAPKKESAPQIIEQPTVSNIQSSAATITWLTDIESTSTVRYGLVSGQLIFRDSSAARVTQHLLGLRGMRSNTTYYFRASSTTRGGTAVSEEFSFRTGLGINDLGPVAWANYKAGSYWDAIALFKELLQLSPTSHEACNGLGWCYAANPVDSLQTSLDYFRAAIGLMANFPDAYAGRGFVYLALNYYAFAIDDFNKVLAANSDYVFVHNNDIDSKDVRLGLAEAYFYTQNFSSAQTQVDFLAPDNGLKADDAGSWAVDGIIYHSYPEALLAWIEKLMTMIN